MSLIEEYYDTFDEFSLKYKNVAVLMQVGGFYEMYSSIDENRGNATKIAPLINCELAVRADKKTLMGGFPLKSLDKNIAKLVEHDYTVVVLEQKSKVDCKDDSSMELEPDVEKSQRMKRLVTQIISKGTFLENPKLFNNTLAIYCKRYSKDYITFGIANTDAVLYGNIITHEVRSLPDDKGIAIDTVLKLVTQYNPVECVVVTTNGQWEKDIDHL
ncbi:hypothetical protein BDK51DRAFT_28900, partial [Blyttiomyces helicus]